MNTGVPPHEQFDDCSTGYVCVNNECVSKGTCMNTGVPPHEQFDDCSAGFMCVNNECIEDTTNPCSTQINKCDVIDCCSNNFSCQNGVCEENPSGCYEPGTLGCTSAGDCCGTDPDCELGVCIDRAAPVLDCRNSPTPNASCSLTCQYGGLCNENTGNCVCIGRPPAGPGGNLNPIDDPGKLFQIFYRVLYPITLFVGLLLVAKSAYTIMTSQGNPDSTKKGKEDLTSAIIGTLFVLLSAGILRVIINSLLGDPGF